MNNRILVKAYAGEHGIDFRTVSRITKSPHRFYITRSKLARLEQEPYIVEHDIHSFAVLWLDSYRDTLTIDFTWLGGNAGALSGREETVVLPYGRLADFLRDSAREDGPKEWQALSMDISGRRPRLVFDCKKTLRAVLNNGVVRRKLFKCLQRQFRWPDSDQVCLYSDFVPYSFFFRETRRGRPGVCGGLILHNQEDMKNAYYSIHT